MTDLGLQEFQLPNKLRFTLGLMKIHPMILSLPCTQPRYFHMHTLEI